MVQGKSLKKVVLFVSLAAIVFFAFASPLFAFTVKGGQDVVVSENVNDDLYVSGSTVIVSGNIDGDLVASGGRLTVEGKVTEDLMIAGGFIDVNGEIGDDIRAAGGIITINSPVTDDLVVAGGTLDITDKGTIGGDLVVTGGEINIAGDVTGKLIASGGNITISGKIGKDAEIGDVGNLKIESGAEINGNLTYQSSQKAQIADGAKITGDVKFTEVREPEKARTPVEVKPAAVAAPLGIFSWLFGATYLISMIVAFLSLFVIGIILLKLIPMFFRKFNDRMKSAPGICAGAGAITIFGTPIGILMAWVVGFVLILTVVGLGIAGLLFAATVIVIVLYWVLIYVSSIFIAFLIGELILSKSKLDLSKYGWKVLAYFIGLAILTVIFAIPFLGGIVMFLAVLFGVGGISILIWDWIRQSAKCVKQ
jgi:cytoskeletal protein CcmA (bactofilin family)